MPGCLAIDGGCVDFLDHLAFHLHIDLKVNVCGVDIRMSEPVADHADVISRAQQVHRGGMAKGVGG